RNDKDRSITTEKQDDTLIHQYSFTTHSGTQQEYTTAITVDTPFNLDSGVLVFDLDLDPQEQQRIVVDVTARSGGGERKTHPLLQPRSQSSALLQQSYRDLEALTTTTPDGPVPLAGTPWFMTVFARDACITAFEALPAAPELASGTLKHLASLQGEENDPETLAEAGKIHHEVRYGEQAARHETPFRRYYGAVDTPPLWIILLTAYYRHRNQPRIIEDLEDSLDAALAWLE
ncbi:MAG: hypothetical protein SVU32_00470, partial [Candidatus Nanohaloarchaea archaeon]|nr:hypothetical protein [Candidatus Nanohaloarchaea archaeon]